MEKSFLKSLKFLIKEFKYTSKKYKTVTYFRISMHSYLLWIHILESHYSNKNLTAEKLIESLKKYASRKTVLSILSDALNRGYLKKIKSNIDKRVTHYLPTELTVKEYEDWKVDLQKNI